MGGAQLGAGMQAIVCHPGIELVETDIVRGPRTQVVCDANDLPFPSSTFDGAIIQAVLDDVLEPARCVNELHRVLGNNGIVYAESPFLYPVHDGPRDFHRFTHVGHRWLFREFEEISSGPIAGPATALAIVFGGFLVASFESRVARRIARTLGLVAGWWLKYLDRLLLARPGAYDCAIGYYFLGRRGTQTMGMEDLLRSYRGAQGGRGSRRHV